MDANVKGAREGSSQKFGLCLREKPERKRERMWGSGFKRNSNRNLAEF
jgi:hypothetical protein